MFYIWGLDEKRKSFVIEATEHATPKFKWKSHTKEKLTEQPDLV